MINKPIVAGISVLAIILSSYAPSANAEIKPVEYTQSVIVPQLDLTKRISMFNRLNVKIITERPWLNPELKSFMFSDKELSNILVKAGFSGNELKMAMAVAYLESTNRPYAFNKSSNCYGLFQINMSGSLGNSRREKYSLAKNEDLFNPLINAKVAFQMSSGGTNWSAWTTAKSAKKIINN